MKKLDINITKAAFDEIKATAVRIWKNPNYGYHESYVSEKVGTIERLENVKDNYGYIMAMFDNGKQEALYTLLSDETRLELDDRIIYKPGGGFRGRP